MSAGRTLGGGVVAMASIELVANQNAVRRPRLRPPGEHLSQGAGRQAGRVEAVRRSLQGRHRRLAAKRTATAGARRHAEAVLSVRRELTNDGGHVRPGVDSAAVRRHVQRVVHHLNQSINQDFN